MSLSYFALNGFALILFLPGIFLVHMYCKHRGHILSLLDLVLAGTVVWTFVFTVPSMLLGLFTPYVLGFFIVFVGVSVGITFVYVLFLWRHRCSLTWSFHTTEKTTLGLSMYLLLLWVFAGLLTIFTSIIQNIDAVIYYLPMAKAIVQTSGLTYNPFYLSQIAMTYPPTLPLMYAFQLFFIGDIHVRFIPLGYFVLTNLVIYKLANKLGRHRLGVMAMIVKTYQQSESIL